MAAMVQEQDPTGSALPAPNHPELAMFSAVMTIAAVVVAGGEVWGLGAEEWLSDESGRSTLQMP